MRALTRIVREMREREARPRRWRRVAGFGLLALPFVAVALLAAPTLGWLAIGKIVAGFVLLVLVVGLGAHWAMNG